jgi:hypothetical protein
MSRPHSAIMRTSWGLADILILIAIICFVLDAIGLDVRVSLIAVGLAFGFASFLVGNRGFRAP